MPGGKGLKGMPYKRILLVGVLLLFAVNFCRPLWDADTWWHLASGRYISESRSLIPATDPFSYPPVDTAGNRQVILNGYWMAQVLMYAVYAGLGYYGLIAYNALLLSAVLLMIMAGCRRSGAGFTSGIAVTVIAGFTLMGYTALRPQEFSFLLSCALVVALESIHRKYREGSIHPPSVAALYAVMVLWANLHRGFMIGSVFVSIYLLAEAVQWFRERPAENPLRARYIALLAFSIALTFVNPNTYRPYSELLMFEGSGLQGKVSEYMPPMEYALKHHGNVAAYAAYFLLVIAVALRTRFKMELRHLLLIAFTAAISLKAYRYIPFFVCSTAPLVAAYLHGSIRDFNRAAKAAATAAIVLGLAVFSILNLNTTLLAAIRTPVAWNLYPRGAAQYMLDNGVSGNIFNHYDWGGYLMWTLYPRYKVFIDGRVLNTEAFYDYTHMLWDTDNADRLLEKYRINTVIMPPVNPFTNENYPLYRYLLASKGWRLSYADRLSGVFTRRAGPQSP